MALAAGPLAATIDQPTCLASISEMLGRRVHNLMTGPLIAVILAGSLLSPAVHHAHAGGGVPHSHSDLAGHDASHEQHRHCHGGQPHTREDRDASRVSSQGHLADNAAHLHIALLWIDFTLPLEGNPSEAPLPVGEESLVVLRLTPDAVSSLAYVVVIALVDQWSAAAVSAAFSDAEGLLAVRPRQGRADQNLLCDSARGVRSGVLLI